MKITLFYPAFILVLVSGCTLTSRGFINTLNVASGEAPQLNNIATFENQQHENQECKMPVGLICYELNGMFSDEGLISSPAVNISQAHIPQTAGLITDNSPERPEQIEKENKTDPPESQPLTGLLLGTLSVSFLGLGGLLLLITGFIIFWPFLISLLLAITGFSFSIKSFKYQKSHAVSKKFKLNSVWGFWLNGSVISIFILSILIGLALYFIFHAFLIYENG